MPRFLIPCISISLLTAGCQEKRSDPPAPAAKLVVTGREVVEKPNWKQGFTNADERDGPRSLLVDVEVVSTSRTVAYRYEPGYVTGLLVDDLGNQYRPTLSNGRVPSGGRTEPETLAEGRRVADRLAFPVPPSSARTATLHVDNLSAVFTLR